MREVALRGKAACLSLCTEMILHHHQGLVLEDNPRNGTVFVAEVVPGGNADQSGAACAKTSMHHAI